MITRAFSTSSPYQRPRTYRRPIVQYDRAGNLIAAFPSLQAAGRATGVNHGNVSRAASYAPGHHTAGGFLWRWADDPNHLYHQFKRTGDTVARNELIEHYRWLVRLRAARLHERLPREVQFDDMVSAGTLGLMRAVELFDAAKKVGFQHFAQLKIDGAMIDELRRMDHVPRAVRNRAGRLSRVADAITAETGRAPSAEQLRTALNVSQRELARLARARIVERHSLSSPFDSAGRDTLEGVIESKTPPPECDPSRTSLRDVLLRNFTLSDALLIRLYYLDGCTMRQIGGMLGGVTETTVCVRHWRIIRKLRQRFAREELSELIGGEAA